MSIEKFCSNEVIRKYYMLKYRINAFYNRFLARFNLYTRSLITDALYELTNNSTCQRAIDENVFDTYLALYTDLHKVLVQSSLLNEKRELSKYLTSEIECKSDDLLDLIDDLACIDEVFNSD